MTEAGYSEAEAAAIKNEVTLYENLRSQVKLHSRAGRGGHRGAAPSIRKQEKAVAETIEN